MKTTRYVLCILSSTLLITSCKKGNSDSSPGLSLPRVTTTVGSAITATTAQSGGTISSDGGSAITARGVCWSSVNPKITDSKTTDGTGTGSFISSITNLTPVRVYEVRAYATNSVGTAYGNTITIVTEKLLSVPTLTTDNTAVVNNSQAVTGGEITSDGNEPVTARGVCWSTSQNPTIANSKTVDGQGPGSFVSEIDGLTVNVTYYARAYATNSIGTGYGNQITFTTEYLIGQLYEGGKVFYVDNTHLHGLIAATSDQGGAKWDNNTSGSFASINAYSYSDGGANTDAIVNTIGNNGNAASLCKTYNGGGYTDWYLPSRDELGLLYQQKTAVGNFQNYYYWSSTASSSYIGFAWSQDFGSGYQYDNSLKTSLYNVRAIRSF